MNIKSTILKEVSLLLEKRIAKISASLNISLSFDVINHKGGHASQRMGGRDLEGYDNRKVSNAEIRYLIEDFRTEIAENIVYGDIVDGDSFVVKSQDKGLSLVLKAFSNGGFSWKLIVVTVFREGPNHILRVGRDQVVIEK